MGARGGREKVHKGEKEAMLDASVTTIDVRTPMSRNCSPVLVTAWREAVSKAWLTS